MALNYTEARYFQPCVLHDDEPSLVLLTCLYFAVAAFAVSELARYVRKQHIVFSLRAFLILLCLLLSLLRFVLLLLPLAWTKFPLIFVAVILPLFLQAVAYSSLVLFLVKCVAVLRGGRGPSLRTLYYLFAGWVVLVAGCSVLFTFFLLRPNGTNSTFDVDHQMGGYSSAIFLILTIGAAVGGGTFYRLMNRGVVVAAQMKREVRQFLSLLTLYLILFLVRSVWDMLNTLGLNPAQTYVNQMISRGNLDGFFWSMFGFYLVMEVLPCFATILILKLVYAPRGTEESRSLLDPIHTTIHQSRKTGRYWSYAAKKKAADNGETPKKNLSLRSPPTRPSPAPERRLFVDPVEVEGD
mmetsp:Transcript_18872/g.47965  ORF Transcript_18872/g.47965 Transcript_18872/m.47965 type:complete len:353 (+) Transcript_18872:351-1409(+)